VVNTVPAKVRGPSAESQTAPVRVIQMTPRGPARSTIRIGRAKADPTTIGKRTKTFNGKRRARASGLSYC